MANFADTAAGRQTAEALCITRMAAGVWVDAHLQRDADGHTSCRFKRHITGTGTGAWVESRDDAQDA